MFLGTLLAITGARSTFGAREKKVRSEKSFYKLVSREELAVVMFYEKNKETKRDPEMRRNIKDLEYMFRSASKKPLYREARVQFLQVNIAKRKLDLLAQSFNVTQMPTFMLFKNGIPYKSDGAIVQLKGTVKREQLIAFIDEHFEERIDEIMKDIVEYRKQRAQVRRYRYYSRPYYSPYFYYRPYYNYWYYPYRHGYYPYGFGFNFGRWW